MLKYLWMLTLLAIPTPVLAQENSATSTSGSAAGALIRVDQGRGSTTENTSNVGGTVVNQGINNSSSLNIPGRAQLGDIVCEVPVFEVSAAMTNPGNGFSVNQSIIATFRTPLRSAAQEACERRSELSLLQAELDTDINLIRFCLDLRSQGVELNENAPKEITSACNMVD